MFLLIIVAFSPPSFSQRSRREIRTTIYPSRRQGRFHDRRRLQPASEISAYAQLPRFRFSIPGISGKPPRTHPTARPDREILRCHWVRCPAHGSPTRRAISGPLRRQQFAQCLLSSDRPEIVAPEKSDSTAVNLPIDTIMNGRCPANAADSYSVDLKQGQRVLIECLTREIDSRLAPVMTIRNAVGIELARSRRGGLIDFYRASADGTYNLELHDLLYKGGPQYFYRLSASTGPHIDSIFPPAGFAGTKAKYTLARPEPSRRLADNSPLARRMESRLNSSKWTSRLPQDPIGFTTGRCAGGGTLARPGRESMPLPGD